MEPRSSSQTVREDKVVSSSRRKFFLVGWLGTLACSLSASRSFANGTNGSVSNPGQVDKRLVELNIILPNASSPVANYVPFVQTGKIIEISGQLSRNGDVGIRGVVGLDIDLEMARQAARLCGLNIISHVREACGGDLGKVRRLVKLNGFVQVAPGFSQIPLVINGCSDLMVDVFGEAGRHARSAVGVTQLPLNFSVEIDAVFEVA
jgi:enamine deaminase RidA (YjgF/YER057c/UK114 family)